MTYHQTADVAVNLTEAVDAAWIVDVDVASATTVVSGLSCFSSAAAASDAAMTVDAAVAIIAVSGLSCFSSAAAVSEMAMTADAVVDASYNGIQGYLLWYPCVLLYSFFINLHLFSYTWL
ncbi:Uncharacterised protein [uncultured Clostridium sp.]|nr:Uncharacterised protein [uncultured Clostridium sp.]